MNRKQLIDRFHGNLISRQPNAEGYYYSGWSSRQSQAERFAALLQVSKFTGGSVVDYGCGTGDLYGYLVASGLPFEYRGYDQNAEMLAIAKRQYREASFSEIAIDAVDFDPADFVLASGVFQFRDADEPTYFDRVFKSLFALSRTALAVTLLSGERDHDNKSSDELYFMPDEAIQLADILSKFWILDHSYHVGSGDMALGIHRRDVAVRWTRPHPI